MKLIFSSFKVDESMVGKQHIVSSNAENNTHVETYRYPKAGYKVLHFPRVCVNSVTTPLSRICDLCSRQNVTKLLHRNMLIDIC